MTSKKSTQPHFHFLLQDICLIVEPSKKKYSGEKFSIYKKPTKYLIRNLKVEVAMVHLCQNNYTLSFS